jgi:hypothetical protein
MKKLIKSKLHFVKDPKEKEEKGESLTKSILNVLNSGQVERLSFEENPNARTYSGLFHTKTRLLPDTLLKRIAIQDELVATIVRTRQNHLSSFGRPRPDRFSAGFELAPKVGVVDTLSPEERKTLFEQIKKATTLLWNCGYTDNVPSDDRQTFSEWLALSVRSGIVCGRVATERVFKTDQSGNPKFHYFRSVDAGTIYRAVKREDASLASVRKQALAKLEREKGVKLFPELETPTEYAYVQVIDDHPFQAYTADEMVCKNFYPVPDIELEGYPVTPLDTIISAVTTHINITTYNKLYFQSGRAAKGLVVIKSDDASPEMLNNIKQQFNASINNVNNSHRMPVLGCALEEEITWKPMDPGGSKDMEFQYLSDMNARVIISAFMMSPDELPGWSYLSKGSNSQTLAESNQEFKLTAARDVGIRPLLSGFEDLVNAHILPYIDADLAEKVDFRLVGLEADSSEKESIRLQQDMGIHCTFNQVLEKVEKKPVGRFWGGDIYLNEQYKAILDQYFTVGEILEDWCDRKGAKQDPRLDYRRDAFYFQHQQIMELQKQNAQQEQAQRTATTETPAQDSQNGHGGSRGIPQAANPEISSAIDQAHEVMSKSEEGLNMNQKLLLAQQKASIENMMRGFLIDSKDVTEHVLDLAKKHIR